MRKKQPTSTTYESDNVFFQQFYAENKGFIYYIARKYVSNPNECDDLVQETIVRLIKNISTLKNMDRCKITKYIVLTVRAAFLDQIKRNKKENVVYLDNEVLEDLMAKELILGDLDQQLHAKTIVAKLKSELPRKDWILLEGKYLMGLSQEELGNLIGISSDSVRMTLHRAKLKAKQLLSEYGVMGGDKNE